MGVAVHGSRVGGKSQSKADRNVVEVHNYFSFTVGREQAPALRLFLVLCVGDDAHIVPLCCRVQHVFNKDAVAGGGIVDEDMGHGTDEFAVLNEWTAGHECVNIGPTSFFRNFRRFCRKNRLNKPLLRHKLILTSKSKNY